MSYHKPPPKINDYIVSSRYPYIKRKRAKPKIVIYDDLPETRLANALTLCAELKSNHTTKNIKLNEDEGAPAPHPAPESIFSREK